MNQSIFFLTSVPTCGIVYFCYFKLMEQFMKPRSFEKRWKLAYILLASELHALRHVFCPPDWKLIMLFVLYLVPTVVFFHGGFVIKALLYLFHIMQVLTYELISVTLVMATGWTLDRVTSLQGISIDFLVAGFFLVALRFICTARAVLQGGLERKVLLCLLGCLGVLGVAAMHIYLSMNVMNLSVSPGKDTALRLWIQDDIAGIFVSLMLLLGLPYLLLSVMRRMEARARTSREAALSLRRAQYELLGYRDAIASEARMRRFRHDMRGYLAALLAMVRSGEHEREAAYIRELIAGLREDRIEERAQREGES